MKKNFFFRYLKLFSICFFLYNIIITNQLLFSKDVFLENNNIWQEFTSLEKNKRPKIALVLGGGGARGFTHIGVIKVLEEEKIPIDIVVGTSIGAIFGALYADGMSPIKIEEITKDISLTDIAKFSFSSIFNLLFKNKFLDSKNIQVLVAKHINDKNFYELNIPFACVAVDIKTGEKIVMQDGNVANAVRASASIPGLFEPVEYKQRFLIDGGIVDNLPISVAKNLGADIIIAVNIEADYTQNQPKTILQVLLQISYIQGERLKNEAEKEADFIINPKVNNFSIIDIKKRNELILKGEFETRKDIKNIKKIILEKTIEYNKKANKL